MRILSSLAVLFVLGLAPAAMSQGIVADGVVRVEPETPDAGVAKAARPEVRGRARQRVPVELDPPTAAELAQLEAPRKPGVPHQIGFPRPIATLQGEDGTGRKLDWETLEDGTLVAALSVHSPGAKALRLGLRVTSIPPTARVRFHDADGEGAFEVSGAEILAVIDANLAAGEHGPDARTYWSPVIDDDTIVVEIELPSGSRPNELRMAIPLASHLAASTRTDFMVAKAAASCNRDATCDIDQWRPQMNAVARMVFSSGGSSFVCTGTLLADLDTSTTIPYFLSANHCIGSQTAASSLVTYWFYRSTACNNGVRGPFVQLGGGATLLYRSTATDVSFMRLNSTPPVGATYAGWMAGSALPRFSPVTGLHHPTGDLLKISGGSVTGYLTCTAPTSTGQFSCSPLTSATNATYYDVSWNSGIVEGGSSGSALFESGKYVVGQLYGGSSSCTAPGSGDSYGRFDVAYRAALATWLDPPPPPPQNLTVLRAGSGSGTVTSTPDGINCGSTCSALFTQGSTVSLVATPLNATFGGWGGACSGTGACTVTMSSAAAVTATFNPIDLGVATVPGSLTFGAQQVSQSVTFTNNTGVRVTFLQAQTSSARFMQSNNCGEVAPGASCTATISYHAGNSGADRATFTMTSTASNSPHVVSLAALQVASSPLPRLTNISARMRVQGGNAVMIGGFVIGGSASKSVLVRARGPSLAAFGIGNALANPTLQLVRASDQAIVAANDDWVSAPNASAIGATGYAPSYAAESAVYVTLPPGAYTAVVSGVGGTTGVGMVEIFEVDQPEVPLANMSMRGHVLTGNDVMIGGFVIQGESPKTVVLRARGPSLAAFGIANPLADPHLQLVRSSDQATIATNDNWGTATNAGALTASGFAPPNGAEAAILVTLEPGAYTAIVSGAGGGTGVAIVEVFAQ